MPIQKTDIQESRTHENDQSCFSTYKSTILTSTSVEVENDHYLIVKKENNYHR